ncbi:AlbA family DNA-binding domain-containing protein [Halocatena marina]|uniref:AlbA family DNA-binding domain-containing protein n=1 Tax=Halocatena marina TaxID=2934937 RepID=UPI002223FCEA|nr:ATP-binding protein [Halocatena marina]
MIENVGNPPWHKILRGLLESPEVDDSEIVDIIESEVPQEGEILDYKGDLYISAKSDHHIRRRESRIIKLFTALANVRTQARFRYVFIGFDDNGEFIGMQYRQPREGEQLLDVDDARVRNILDGKVTPTPDFEVFELDYNGKEGGVVVIRQAEQVPLVVEKTLRKNGGGEFIAAGQAYTREGSKTKRMKSSDFRDLMRYREELINEKIRELSDEFAQVVGIPDEQLAGFELKVAPSDDDAMPMGELVTPNPTKDTNEALNSAVKTWRSTGSLDFERPSLYRFFDERNKLVLAGEDDEEDKKTEFLIRANLKNYFHGAYWICEYSHDIDELFNTIIKEDIGGTTIRPLERALMVMGKQSHLRRIGKMNLELSSSRANEYATHCNDAIHDRVGVYASKNLKIGSDSYPVYDLVYGNTPTQPIDLMEELVSDLRDEDENIKRDKLRDVELIYLARNT